jgi:hypothetical protein
MMHGQSPARGRGSGGGEPVRRMPGRWGRKRCARAWTDEMNDARGEKKISAGGQWLRFNGKRRGGGSEGWTPCGGGGGERERGEPGAAWSSATAWRRRGSGIPKVWRGVRSSVAGCGAGQHGEAVSAALTGGIGSTVRLIRFSNRIKFISNGFKFAPNFDQSKRCLPVLQKF